MRVKVLLVVLLWAFPVLLQAKCGVPATRRGKTATAQFKRQTGYPHGRVGYVVDHIVPLCLGGADTISNLQWQTLKDARAKDKIECQCEIPLRKVLKK